MILKSAQQFAIILYNVATTVITTYMIHTMNCHYNPIASIKLLIRQIILNIQNCEQHSLYITASQSAIY